MIDVSPEQYLTQRLICRRDSFWGSVSSIVVWAALGLSVLNFPTGVAAIEEGDERALKMKSAFIYYVSKLVNFTARKGGEGIRLCVVGNSSLAKNLSHSLANRSIQGGAPQIIDLGEEELKEGKVPQCHLAYLESAQLLGKGPVLRLGLTLGEDKEFLKNGGVLELFEEQNKFRFRVNMKAAQRANIELPSDLLALATEVVHD